MLKMPLTRKRWLRILPAVLLLLETTLGAQGLQTGVITGTVVSGDGAPIPDVTVTVTAPELQGVRSATTNANGLYAVRGLPAGRYAVSVERSTFQPATHDDVAVTLGGTTTLDVAMSLAGRAEAVTVTAERPSLLGTSGTGQAIGKQTVDALPIGRRPVDIADLTPGLSTATFTAGQVSIGGAFGFDNVFMVNGVDTNDNVFGSQNALFIEDAVQETTVLVGGLPADYGRFSGGVVNVVTRSGGNRLSGSVRENLSNPHWVRETPREVQNGIRHNDSLNKVHEATLGGPIVRDRLWYFGAARYERATIQNTLAQTGGAYVRRDTNARGEVKVTGAFAPGRTAQVSYIANGTEQQNTSGLAATSLVDARTLVTRQLPLRLFAASANGALRGSLFGSVQYSEKRQRFEGNGGTSTDIRNSPFRTLGATAGVPGSLFYHAPYLDATDPEQRNNRQVAGSVVSLLPSPVGSHELKAGAEYFVATGIGGNSQSPSGYVFATDYVVQGGRPVLDATGSPIPVFTPGATEVWNFRATRGARIDLRTTSLFAADHWTVTPRLTLDLGARLEAVRGRATGDLTTVDTWSIVPRLGLAYAIPRSAGTTLFATYGHYDGKYNQVQFSSNTNVSRPSEVDYAYSGPAGQGSDFAPGFDLANYTRVTFVNVPTANIRMSDDLHSPVVREMTLGLGRDLGRGGYARATYVRRTTSGFVEDFADRTTGTTTVPLVGTITTREFRNTDERRREYQALLLQGSLRAARRVTAGGSYTLQIRNEGNIIGEATNQPAVSSIYGDYPEVYGPALDRLLPDGRLDTYQRHKLRLYGTLSQGLGRFGSVDLSPIWRVNSAAVYSLSAPITLTPQQLARNPGYPASDINASVRETVYFGARGASEFKGYGLLDLAATYGIPLWRSASPWLKLEWYNVLNNQKQIAWDRTVSADRTGPVDASGIPTAYVKGPRFGQATSDTQYPQPYAGQNGGRAFRMAFGVRF